MRVEGRVLWYWIEVEHRQRGEGAPGEWDGMNKSTVAIKKCTKDMFRRA